MKSNVLEGKLLADATRRFNFIMLNDDISVLEKLEAAWSLFYWFSVAASLIESPTKAVELKKEGLDDECFETLADIVGKDVYRWYNGEEDKYILFVKDALEPVFDLQTLEGFNNEYCYGNSKLDTFEPTKVMEMHLSDEEKENLKMLKSAEYISNKVIENGNRENYGFKDKSEDKMISSNLTIDDVKEFANDEGVSPKEWVYSLMMCLLAKTEGKFVFTQENNNQLDLAIVPTEHKEEFLRVNNRFNCAVFEKKVKEEAA